MWHSLDAQGIFAIIICWRKIACHINFCQAFSTELDTQENYWNWIEFISQAILRLIRTVSKWKRLTWFSGKKYLKLFNTIFMLLDLRAWRVLIKDTRKRKQDRRVVRVFKTNSAVCSVCLWCMSYRMQLLLVKWPMPFPIFQ